MGKSKDLQLVTSVPDVSHASIPYCYGAAPECGWLQRSQSESYFANEQSVA